MNVSLAVLGHRTVFLSLLALFKCTSRRDKSRLTVGYRLPLFNYARMELNTYGSA